MISFIIDLHDLLLFTILFFSRNLFLTDTITTLYFAIFDEYYVLESFFFYSDKFPKIFYIFPCNL